MRTSPDFTCDSWCLVFDLEGECVSERAKKRERQRERERKKFKPYGFKLDRMTIQSNTTDVLEPVVTLQSFYTIECEVSVIV
jgi:hypothetical protein